MGYKAVCRKLCCDKNIRLYVKNPGFLLLIPYSLAWKYFFFCRLEDPQIYYYLPSMPFAFFNCLLLMWCQISIQSCRYSFTFCSPSKQQTKKLFTFQTFTSIKQCIWVSAITLKNFSDYFHRNGRIRFDNKCDVRFITLKYLTFPRFSTIYFLSLQ